MVQHYESATERRKRLFAENGWPEPVETPTPFLQPAPVPTLRQPESASSIANRLFLENGWERPGSLEDGEIPPTLAVEPLPAVPRAVLPEPLGDRERGQARLAQLGSYLKRPVPGDPPRRLYTGTLEALDLSQGALELALAELTKGRLVGRSDVTENLGAYLNDPLAVRLPLEVGVTGGVSAAARLGRGLVGLARRLLPGGKRSIATLPIRNIDLAAGPREVPPVDDVVEPNLENWPGLAGSKRFGRLAPAVEPEAKLLPMAGGMGDNTYVPPPSLFSRLSQLLPSPPPLSARTKVQTGRLLSDPTPFETEMAVDFAPTKARALGEALQGQGAEGLFGKVQPAVSTVLGPALRHADPSLGAQSPVARAAITRAHLLEEGKAKTTTVMDHLYQLGSPETLFGPSDPKTGLLSTGLLQGHSLTEVAENTSLFPQLTPEMRRWFATTEVLEDETRLLAKRNGIEINELEFTGGARYARRIHVAKLDDTGEVIAEGYVGAPASRLARRTGPEHLRRFETQADAQAAGFVPLSYDASIATTMKSMWNRVVNKRTAEWLEKNLPAGVKMVKTAPGSEAHFGEATVPLDFPGKRFTGPEAQEFTAELNRWFNPAAVPPIIKGINQYNSVQRMFALAGDPSLLGIQLIGLIANQPRTWLRSGGAFADGLLRSILSPTDAAKWAARRRAVKNDIIQRAPNLIMSGNGLEPTEALSRGGVLGPRVTVGKPGFGQSRLFQALASTVRPFQFAYETAMDEAGMNLFEALEPLAKGDPTKLRAVIDHVNQMRGVTSSAGLGVSPAAQAVEAGLLLAPRYRRAIASLHASVLQGGLRGELARKAYGKLVAGLLFSYIGVSIGLGMKRGHDADRIKEDLLNGLRPDKSTFLLWSVGTQAFGPGSKFVSDARFLGKLFTQPQNFLKFTDEKGDSVFNQNPGVRWVRSQLAAAPSDAWDILTGESYIGEPITMDFTGDPIGTLKTLGRMVGENVLFLWAQTPMFSPGTVREQFGQIATESAGGRAYPFPISEYDIAAKGHGYDSFGAAPEGAARRRLVQEITQARQLEAQERYGTSYLKELSPAKRHVVEKAVQEQYRQQWLSR